MKKIMAVLLSVVLLLALTACGQPAAPEVSENPEAGVEPSGQTPETDGSPGKIVFICQSLGDLSFNDSANGGLEILKAEHGFETQVIEATNDTSKFESHLLETAESGAEYIIAAGTYQDRIEKVAKEFPDTKFILFDTAPNVEVASDNILYISYAQNEGSYLVGMVAAAKSKSGVVGTIGGIQNPIIEDFMTGYIDGALAYNPDAKVITAWVGNWDDTAKMLELVTAQSNAYKADVFFPVAGGAGPGAFEAALKIGDAWTIGVDADQYQVLKDGDSEMADVIITSMLKEIGNSFVTVFKGVLEGDEPWGTVQVLGIKENSVGYVSNDFFKANMEADAIAKIEEAKEKITAGEIKVKSYFDFADEAEYDKYVASVAP